MELNYELAFHTLAADVEALSAIQHSIAGMLEQLPQVITFIGGFIAGAVIAIAAILELRKW
jgi:hypothetical protein